MTNPHWQQLVGRLQKSIRTPARSGTVESYRALCPCCDKHGRSRKLSVSLLPDGRILMHCFGDSNCDVGSLTAALGLDTADLMPPGLDYRTVRDSNGFGSPAGWMSAAAIADAVALHATSAYANPNSESCLRVFNLAQAFRAAAVDAMRSSKKNKEVKHGN